MKNIVKEEHGPCAGRYERSFDVNGKPSYKKDNYAIWYNIFGFWKIGPIEKLGSHTAYISAKDKFGGLTDGNNVWKYTYAKKWKTAGTYDITVECTSGNSKF